MPIRCEIDGKTLDCAFLGVSLHGFGKKLDPAVVGPLLVVPYSVALSASEVVAKFDDYYRFFIEIESEDDGFEKHPEGDFLLLRNTGYLDLAHMLSEQPDLLSRVILNALPSEFMGYIFGDNNVAPAKYIIHTLSEVAIEKDVVNCKGLAFEHPLAESMWKTHIS